MLGQIELEETNHALGDWQLRQLLLGWTEDANSFGKSAD